MEQSVKVVDFNHIVNMIVASNQFKIAIHQNIGQCPVCSDVKIGEDPGICLDKIELFVDDQWIGTHYSCGCVKTPHGEIGVKNKEQVTL